MIRLTRSIRYTHLRSCGHLTFVGASLERSLTLVGSPLLTLWVESSDADADVFAYLEDQDPDTGKARYVYRLNIEPLRGPEVSHHAGVSAACAAAGFRMWEDPAPREGLCAGRGTLNSG